MVSSLNFCQGNSACAPQDKKLCVPQFSGLGRAFVPSWGFGPPKEHNLTPFI